MRFLRVAVPVTLVVALILGAAPEAGQSAQKPNPTAAQFLSPASPVELVSAHRLDHVRPGQAQRLCRHGPRVRAGSTDVVPQGRRRGSDGTADVRRRIHGRVHARQRRES
jgi:hypothetical protein